MPSTLQKPTLLVSLMMAALLAFATASGASLPADSSVQQGIRQVMSAWINAAHKGDKSAVAALLDDAGHRYFHDIRELALHGTVKELAELHEVDQLQALFFRLMIDGDELAAMDVQAMVAFALDNGLIGMELRRSDVLSELEIDGDHASGRLLKLGQSSRPDPYRQYFVRENESWRVSIRGERERLEGEFDSFVGRSGIARSEATLLILELRLMRKVSLEDLHPGTVAPGAGRGGGSPGAQDSNSPQHRYRLVTVRLPESLVGEPAITVDDRYTGLKYVLRKGQAIPHYPQYTLGAINRKSAIFLASGDGQRVSLELDDGASLDRTPRLPGSTVPSLVDQVQLGAAYDDLMMAQWRNIGLRGRAQLLQQAWLTPEFEAVTALGRAMRGLKVRQLVPSSFWQQLGLEEGDLLQEINGLSIDSLDAWKAALELAGSRQELTVKLVRQGNELVYRASTVRPG